MFDDFQGQHIRWRKVVQIAEAVVLEPEDVEAGFVAGDEGFVVEVFEALGFFALVAIDGVVAVDEVLQVIAFERAGFEGEVLVGAQVLEPVYDLSLAIIG